MNQGALQKNLSTGDSSSADQIQDAANRARETAIEAKDKAMENFSRYSRQAQDYVDNGVETVRKKPLTSVAIASGIGIVIGALMSRRRH